LIAGSVYARRASRIDPANLLPTASRSAIEAIIATSALYLFLAHTVTGSSQDPTLVVE
jgi:hypothetical protein